jgi:hypothetical protein
MKGKIFNAQEVQAIIAGNKTQFREVKVKPNKDRNKSPLGFTYEGGFRDTTKENTGKCPYQIGQKIFVKESFNIFAGQVAYKQSLANAERYIWKPASQMKQEHSRLTLLIKDIRVERLADISEEDLKLEGFKTDYKIMNDGIYKKDSIKFFREDWNTTHKKPEEKFEANPWVWKIDFEVVKC